MLYAELLRHVINLWRSCIHGTYGLLRTRTTLESTNSTLLLYITANKTKPYSAKLKEKSHIPTERTFSLQVLNSKYQKRIR